MVVLKSYRNLVRLEPEKDEQSEKFIEPTPAGIAGSTNWGQRSKVLGFSRKSKLRMHRTLESIYRPDTPIFVTLTYQESLLDYKECKKHLDNFIKWLCRNFEGVCGIWRLEFQKRGAPHYHLVVWTRSEHDALVISGTDKPKKAWCRIIKHNTRASLRHALRAEPANSSQAVYRYLVGHHLKQDQTRDDLPFGRYWGVFGRQHLTGLDPMQEEQLTVIEAIRFRRIAAKYLKRKSSQRVQGLISSGKLKSFYIPCHDVSRILRHVKKRTLWDEMDLKQEPF